MFGKSTESLNLYFTLLFLGNVVIYFFCLISSLCFYLLQTGMYSDFEIRCHSRSYRVHKLVLALFTDHFNEYDGLWVRMDVEAAHLESVLRFIYCGEAVIQYDHMEGFLETCK